MVEVFYPEGLEPELSIEQLRRTLLWVIERTDLSLDEQFGEFKITVHNVCTSCGHGLNSHVVTEHDSDQQLPWPCTYPRILGAPVGLCKCRDYTAARE